MLYICEGGSVTKGGGVGRAFKYNFIGYLYKIIRPSIGDIQS